MKADIGTRNIVNEMPVEVDSIDKVRDFIDHTVKASGYFSAIVHDVVLTVEEAVMNIIKHAYPAVEKEFFSIVATIVKESKDGFLEDKHQRALKITLVDKGVPFDPTQVAAPNLGNKLETLPLGGLGCHLMKQLADTMHYEFKDNKNVLTFTFLDDMS